MMREHEDYPAEVLRAFCFNILERFGVPHADAEITAKVLVEADLRGIDSHGIARLNRYVSGIQEGVMKPKPNPKTLHETLNTATIDGDGGLGQPVSYRAMQLAIKKARRHNMGFVAVRNSNHFGIAGYYAMMALAEDMIGVCTTNSEVLVVPTFASKAMLGTNPIAIAAPANKQKPFVLDMSTSTVTRGKLEVYARLEKPIPLNWATDKKGVATDNPAQVLENITNRSGGGLLPLGGASEETGGHKGYGLALVVEIFSALLPGALYADRVYPKDKEKKPLPSGIGHFFGAMRIDAFRSRKEFKNDMDDLILRLKEAPKTKEAERIYIHGEKEFEEAEKRARQGIPLNPKVIKELTAIAKQVGMKSPF
jgi:LDH2 family malate/lactate/ureidoglycolate dehydrogenase